MTFETAKIGDRVWSLTKGWGEIIRIDYDSVYPLSVKYDSGGIVTFTFGGYLFIDGAIQSLFWDEVVIEAPAKPLPDLQVDAKVVVWNHGQKHNMHFSHFAEVRGIVRMFTFDSGKTSFTTQETSSWGSYEVME